MPDIILLDGDWYIGTDSLTLSWATIQANARAAACAHQKALNPVAACTIAATAYGPTVVVRGSLVVAAGSLTLSAPLMLVGKGNALNFLKRVIPGTPAAPGSPLTVDVAKFQSNETAGVNAEPGLLAVGTKIDAKDYDQDVPNGYPWTGGTYTPQDSSPAFLRGIILNATWDAATRKMTPGQEQHWHVFDPKDLMRLYGAEIGGKLHNCNNFTFSYDPIVKTVRHQGGGSGLVAVEDFQEIRNPGT
jgi:hypothetical protein